MAASGPRRCLTRGRGAARAGAAGAHARRCSRWRASRTSSSRRSWSRRCRPSRRDLDTTHHLGDLGLHRLPAHVGRRHAAARQARRHLRQEAPAGDRHGDLRRRHRRRGAVDSIALLIRRARCRAPPAPSSRSRSGSSATSCRPRRWAWASGCCRPPSAWAAALGLVLSGVILESLPWQWLFWIGAVPVIAALSLVWRLRARVARAHALAHRLVGRGPHPVGRPRRRCWSPSARASSWGWLSAHDPRLFALLGRRPRPVGLGRAEGARADGRRSG